MENELAKPIMVQGTMSSAGKSLLVAALCRIFSDDGFNVAPFKSQNMALNSGVTVEGFEMGRAQIMQAECARKIADVRMNPILLKPTSHHTSQVIVNGIAQTNMNAKDYFSHRTSLVPKILEAYNSLASENDIIVVEGAGSPAEINLKKNDIVNMGLAKMLDAPVILVGDIDRGGVFASLYGTVQLLEPEERSRIKGLVINKFRGDVSLLQSGLDQIEELTQIPVLGVIPFIENLKVDDEDSLSKNLTTCLKHNALFHVAVVKLPFISNFTDINAFQYLSFVQVSFFETQEEYHSNVALFGKPDLIIVPGTKNTIHSLKFLKEKKLDKIIVDEAAKKTFVIGICGGFQVLGESIIDTDSIEDENPSELKALNLLPIKTTFSKQKTLKQISTTIPNLKGAFSCISNCKVFGYEIHHGVTYDTQLKTPTYICSNENILGTYIHGFFDSEEIFHNILLLIAEKKNKELPQYVPYYMQRENEYNRLSSIVKKYLALDKIYSIIKN